jgi:glycosyltransferase involved in cell wall biosynthesis
MCAGGESQMNRDAHKTSLSVLVPVYNEQYLVGASLQRLRVLAESPLLERVQVIVVDDCSTDQMAAVLAQVRQ